MRTTLTIDDGLLRRLKQAALERQLSLKEMINRALQAGLQAIEEPPARRYRPLTFSMGTPQHLNLDKATAIAGELETEEVLRKQALRK